jgi:hypothetical protein
MKIGKNLLKQNEEDSLGTQELYSEDTCWNISQLYENALKKYTKKNIWFLSPTISEARRKQRYGQIRKFIDLCIEFEISFEVVMDEQIKVLVKFIKEKKLPMKYPPFNMLISENARKRMGYLKSDIARRYSGKARVEESHKVPSLNIEKSLRESMGKVYDQFKRTKDFIGAIQEFEATTELEIMARAKLISNIYIYSSSLSEKIEFLKQIKEDTGKRLSKQQKEAIVKIKENLISEFKDGEIKKYL